MKRIDELAQRVLQNAWTARKEARSLCKEGGTNEASRYPILPGLHAEENPSLTPAGVQSTVYRTAIAEFPSAIPNAPKRVLDKKRPGAPNILAAPPVGVTQADQGSGISSAGGCDADAAWGDQLRPKTGRGDR